MKIIVNAVKVEWECRTINYYQLVNLAWPSEQPPSMTPLYTIQYSHPKEKGGTIIPNEFVVVKEGMIFEVVVTSNA